VNNSGKRKRAVSNFECQQPIICGDIPALRSGGQD
jgi:hypothetical protein